MPGSRIIGLEVTALLQIFSNTEEFVSAVMQSHNNSYTASGEKSFSPDTFHVAKLINYIYRKTTKKQAVSMDNKESPM